MPIPAAQIVVALIAHIGGPLMQASSAHDAAAPVEVTIADHVAKVAAGETVQYEVTATPVMVKLTLSPSVGVGAVAWDTRPSPGEARVYTVAAVLNSKVDTADPAAMACVRLDASSPALAYATHLHIVATPRDRGWVTWALAIFLGLCAVAGSVWLQRAIAPPLLTPDNAASIYESSDLPGEPPLPEPLPGESGPREPRPRQPGGAPSL